MEKNANLTDRSADQAFTMQLNGVVDAAVSGGIRNYELFLTGEYAQSYPEIVKDVDEKGGDMVERLKKSLSEQMHILTGCLEVHSRVCSEAVLPLHEHLMGRFAELKTMMTRLGVQVQ